MFLVLRSKLRVYCVVLNHLNTSQAGPSSPQPLPTPKKQFLSSTSHLHEPVFRTNRSHHVLSDAAAIFIFRIVKFTQLKMGQYPIFSFLQFKMFHKGKNTKEEIKRGILIMSLPLTSLSFSGFQTYLSNEKIGLHNLCVIVFDMQVLNVYFMMQSLCLFMCIIQSFCLKNIYLLLFTSTSTTPALG